MIQQILRKPTPMHTKQFLLKKLITLLIGHSNNLIPSKSQKYAKIQLHDTLCVNGNLRF